MSRFASSLALAVSLVAAAPASADQVQVPSSFTQIVVSPASAPGGATARQAGSAQAPPIWTTTIVTEPNRPSAMVPMYVGFATLQGLDYHTTTRALSTGVGREGNPVMGNVAGNKGAFLAVKAASTAGVILVGEKLWKKNRAGAVVFMAVANGLMASVVAHNYSVLR